MMDGPDLTTLDAHLAAARATVAALEAEAQAAEARLGQIIERLADARTAAKKAYGRLKLASIKVMLGG